MTTSTAVTALRKRHFALDALPDTIAIPALEARQREASVKAIEDATLVRVRDGEVLVTDGPFTESKEWIAGYDLIEAADLDEAIEIASKHPMARFGRIELRPVWPL